MLDKENIKEIYDKGNHKVGRWRMEGEDRSKTGDEKQPSTSVTMSQIGHEF